MSRHFGGMSPVGGSDRTTKILVSVGVFFALILLALAFLFLYSGPSTASTIKVEVEKESDEPAIRMIDVLVPVDQIESGAALEAAMFRKETRPQVGLSPRVIKDFEEIKGQWSRTAIIAGQPLQREYITGVRPTNAITAKIPEGFRAVSISVNAISGVEGWARPGARVDVVWASRIRGQPGVTVIVQNAQVLSAERDVNQNVKAGVPVPNTVTLLVNASDAAKIQLAQTTGSLSLSLRGDNDGGKGSTVSSITVQDLLGTSGDGKGVATEDRAGSVSIGGIKYNVSRDGKLIPSGE